MSISSSLSIPLKPLQSSTSNSNAGSRPNSNNQKHRRSSSKSLNFNNNNNARRSNSSDNLKSANKLTLLEQTIAAKHMDDRTLFLLSNAIGSKCIVTVSSGTRYLGLLYTTSSFLESPISVVLKFPELYSVSPDDDLDPNEELSDTLYIEAKDFADLEILDLDLTIDDNLLPPESSKSLTPNGVGGGFKTDVDISAALKTVSRDQPERELQKWVAEEDEGSILDGGLDDLSSDNKKWDQFAVNERKFGIQSSFNEELYTTKISKDDPKYKERLEVADRLLREIESSAHNGNIHLAEERGIAVDDSGYDEEDKYSGVDRRGEELMAAIKAGSGSSPAANSNKSPLPREFSPNKYVPPRLRAAQYHDDPAVLSSTDMNKLKDKQSEDKKNLPSTLPDKPGSKVPGTATASKPTTSFNSETSKINAQSEINALKEFSANFKIPTKFPKDLLPIVTKDKSKQEEIVKKFDEELEKQKKDLDKKDASADAKTTTQKPLAPLRKKMDPKNAITFKMNPNTAAFQPSNFTPPVRPSYGNRSPGTMHSSPRLGNQLSPAKKPLTAAGFFGARVPKETENDTFKDHFNLFVFVGSADKLEKPFVTAPTWDLEIDDTHLNLYDMTLEKLNVPLPPPPTMRYYPGAAGGLQSPMGALPPQLIPPVTPLSPQHPHQSPIPLQAPIHPQQVPIMMLPPTTFDDGNRNLSPSPQLIPPYYSPYMPAGAIPPLQPRGPPPIPQDPATSPRQQRHNSNSNSSNSNNSSRNNHHNHHHHNNNNSHHQQQQMLQRLQMLQMMLLQQQGQYPMLVPMPPQGGPNGGQGPRGAPPGAGYPQMGYYIVGPPNGRQF